jgi:hypothetical protein
MKVTSRTVIRYVEDLLQANNCKGVQVIDTQLPDDTPAFFGIDKGSRRKMIAIDFEQLSKIPDFIVPTILHEVGHVVCKHRVGNISELNAEIEATRWAIGYLNYIVDTININNIRKLLKHWRARGTKVYKAVARELIPMV